MKFISIVSLLIIASTGSAFSECRQPRQFISNSSAENTTNFINFLVCLHNDQERRIAILERDLAIGRQELSEMNALYQHLIQQVNQ